MKELIPIESCPGYAKDMSSGAILNTDINALKAYKTRRKMMREMIQSQARINDLEGRLDRIEKLLLKVLEK